MPRHIDFDATWGAILASREAPTMTVWGERIDLPPEEPLASVLLRRQLRDPEARAAVSLERVLHVLRLVFGADVVDRWIDAGIDGDRLFALLMTLPAAWAPEQPDPEAGAEGEAQPPETGASTSSSTTSSAAGTSSSPTSTATTGLT